LFPVWSPDGERIVFASSRGRGFDPYVTTAPGQETLLVDLEATSGWPLDWSPDGRSILQFSGSALWIIPMDDGEPVRLTAGASAVGQARFSPDGRWIAYVSNESGREEVYVRAFPGPGRQQAVSAAGGSEPQWRGDGRELFYVSADDALMVVAVDGSSAAMTLGSTERLFTGARGYQAARDGRRFLLTRTSDQEAAVSVVLNWQSALAH
jgi:Tol biopolymer transport system component